MSEVTPAKSLWDSIKKKLVVSSLCAVFSFSATSALAHDDDLAAEEPYYDPVAPALVCQHFNDVAALNALPDAEREKTARHRLAADTSTAQKPTQENVCSKLAMIDALYTNGLTKEEKKLIQETLARWTQGENQKFFAAMLDRDSREIAQILMKDPVFMAAFDRYALAKSYSIKQQGQDPVLTEAELQHISNVIRNYYDLPPTTVRFAKMSETINGMHYDTLRIGYYARMDVIEINPVTATYFFITINTIAHETRHSVDGDLMNLLQQRRLSPGSPRALYAAILSANLYNYSVFSADEEDAYENYYNQPIENYAFVFGKSIARTLESELYSLKNSPFMLKTDKPRVLNLV